MNNQEYKQQKRECWEEFCDKHLFDPHNIVTQGIFGYAFDRAYELGKQEIKQETDADNPVIQGWVCRDTDDLLRLHYSKPERTDGGYWQGGYKSTYLPKGLFPDLTWESEPQECEIIIKRKNESR